MISIDRFEEILSDLAEEIPQSFYEELNGGIVVEPGYLLHPEDRNGTLYVMGQYRIDPAMGKYIVMYYGSFKRAYRHLDEDELTDEKSCGMNSATTLKDEPVCVIWRSGTRSRSPCV